MKFETFRWGPVAQGLYIALLWFSVVVSWHFSHWLGYYLLLLVFLGLGLRPLLERTGLYGIAQSLALKTIDKHQDRRLRERRRQIERSERDKKYRQRRKLDPTLPKSW